MVLGLGVALLVGLTAAGRAAISRATTLDRSETCAEVHRLLQEPEFGRLMLSDGQLFDGRNGTPDLRGPRDSGEREALTRRAVDTARELGGVSAATTDDELALLVEDVAYGRLVALGVEPAQVDPGPLPSGVPEPDFTLSPEQGAKAAAAVQTVQLAAACRPAGEPAP